MGGYREQPIRVAVMASSAKNRRALRAIIPRIEEVKLLEATSNTDLVRRCLEQEVVHALVVDDSPEGQKFIQEMQTRLHRDKVQLIDFQGTQSIGRAIHDMLVDLNIDPEKYTLGIEKLQRLTTSEHPKVVTVGCSTGGPDALDNLITHLPPKFSPAVLVAQHMLPSFTPILVRRLNRSNILEVREAADGDQLASGLMLLAPSNFHMVVSKDKRSVRLHKGPPEHSCRPSVDVLFRSVAEAFGGCSIGVVLTGMGRDGVDGARALRASGAEVLIQDQKTSVVWGMPGIIHKEGIASFAGSIPDIAEHLVRRSQELDSAYGSKLPHSWQDEPTTRPKLRPISEVPVSDTAPSSTIDIADDLTGEK
ncbi:MAG: chemotaxis protein CheB [Myxococcales bacterium]|nr:chemotaxis protein CheB [Myxococcales bacterium]